MIAHYAHCKHCNYCQMNHPYPCEDSTCREGNRKLKENNA